VHETPQIGRERLDNLPVHRVFSANSGWVLAPIGHCTAQGSPEDAPQVSLSELSRRTPGRRGLTDSDNRPNKWLKRTPPSVTPPARREAQASRHPAAPPLSHTVGPDRGRPLKGRHELPPLHFRLLEGIRFTGGALLVILVVAAGIGLLCVSCTENACDTGPCVACAQYPHMSKFPHRDIVPTGHEPVDTTYLIVRCHYSPAPPGPFAWSTSIGTLGPVVRRVHECSGLGSFGDCSDWLVEEAILWFPPTEPEVVLGALTIDFPDCDTSRCILTSWHFVGPISAGAGHAVGPLVVWSHPQGASIFLDGVATGQKTRSMIGIREFWKSHTVRVELAGYRPESTVVVGPYPGCLDSVVFTLTGEQ